MTGNNASDDMWVGWENVIFQVLLTPNEQQWGRLGTLGLFYLALALSVRPRAGAAFMMWSERRSFFHSVPRLTLTVRIFYCDLLFAIW